MLSGSFIGDALNFDFTPKELLSNEIIPRNVRKPALFLLEDTHELRRPARKAQTGCVSYVQHHHLRRPNTHNFKQTEFLTGCFEGKPSKCTKKQQKQLWNFAFAGADIDKDM